MVLLLALAAFFYSTPALYGPRWAREVFTWPLMAALLFVYWQGYQAVVSQQVKAKWIWLTAILLAGLAISIPPFHSTDLYGYINRGWQQLHYGLNPYVYTVDHISGWEQDAMITNHWVNNPSPYGFLYLLIAKMLCWIGHGDKALTILVFKLWNGLLYLLTACLIGLGAQRLNKSDNLAFRGKVNPRLALYLYLWNPLVLIHSLANGHNDILMGFFVTLAAFLAIVGGWVWILPALMAATLIKYGAVVIAPLAVVFLFKNKAWLSLGAGLILAVLLFGLTGASFLPDWQQFHLEAINENAFVSHGSLHSFVYSIYKNLDRALLPALTPYREMLGDVLKRMLLGGYALFFAGLCWIRFRQAAYSPTQWVRDSLLLMVVLIGLVSLKFYPWYLGMFMPLAFYLPETDWLRRFVVLLSCTQMLAITFIGQAHVLNFLLMTGLPIGWILWKWRQSHAGVAVKASVD